MPAHGPPPMVPALMRPSLNDTVRLFTLSPDQAFAFLLLAQTVAEPDLPQRLMVICTGEPGTGKSQALKAFE